MPNFCTIVFRPAPIRWDPDNILGILTGPLTGTPAVIGSRFVVVAKSPKTAGGWGDANCGGYFGPHLKFAGYDGILFYGISPKLVYLSLMRAKQNCWMQLIWRGNGSFAPGRSAERTHGADCEVCSIGPAGEKLALTACIMNDKERAAGRSGLGAVMGSKKIKAVVVKGKMKVPLHDEAGMKDLKKKILKQATGGYEAFNKYGTAGFTHDSVISGDGPVKNWGGAGTSDFPSEQARKISDDAVIGVEGYKPYGCWRCPIACGGRMSQKSGKFALEFNDGVGHKPEYETLALYGSNLLNDDLSSIIKVNEICNNLGLDTIAAGATIGYAIECYENGLLSKEQTDGMELTWGNAEAIVALTEKMGRREGLGDILADGVAAAWEKFGKIGTEYAVHVQGEEMPAHDPKFIPGLATTYLVSATPARHTQGGELLMPPGFDEPVPDKYTYSGHADIHSKLVAIHEVVNAAGLCMFGTLCYPIQALPEQLSVATGQDYDMQKIYEVGMRIYTMRHAFNLREGLNPLTRNVPGRMIGDPPLKEGNVRDITVDYKLLLKEFLEQIGWDTATSVPADDTLRKLDLDFLIDDLKKADVPAA